MRRRAERGAAAFAVVSERDAFTRTQIIDNIRKLLENVIFRQ
jgi:hypothetical protein